MDVASSNDTKERSRSPRPQLRRSSPQDLPLARSPLSTELDPNDTASVTIEVINDSDSVRDGERQNDNRLTGPVDVTLIGQQAGRHSRNISDDPRKPDTAEPEQEPLNVCSAALDDMNVPQLLRFKKQRNACQAAQKLESILLLHRRLKLFVETSI